MAAPISGGIAKSFPARYPVEPTSRPAVDPVALADQIAKRNAPPVNRAAGTNDQLFAMFAYTGDGVGGQDDQLVPGTLAYSDEALLYLDVVPESLKGARLIRTANLDRNYWANDYIVATAARDLFFFVAHDDEAARPKWLREFKSNGDAVHVNGRKLTLFTRELKGGDQIRISGNLDQGQKGGRALNLILFARPIGIATDRSHP
jgi:beta-galactosidase